MNVHDRLDQLIERLGKNANSFSQELGVSNTHIYYIVKGNKTLGGKKNKPSFDLLQKITNAFPKVNIEWLVSGKGNMFHSEVELEEKQQIETHSNSNFGDEILSRLETEISELKERERMLLEKDMKQTEIISNLSKR